MDEFLDSQKEKKSPFKRFLSFLGNLSPKKREKKSVTQQYSCFHSFLLELDKKDDSYSTVSYSVELCEEALAIVKNRLIIIRKLKHLSDNIVDVESYNNLTDEDIENLKDLLQRTIALSNDRKALMYQVTGFDNSLTHLIDLEEEAVAMIPQMEEAERNQRLFNQDMAILEGEKIALEDERESLQNAGSLIRKFSIFLVVMFGAVTMLLGFLAVFQEVDIFFPVAIMAFLAIILTALIYTFRRQIRYELAMNIKKQKRAVELLNKKSTLYVHHTNFLRYACKKYQVRNAQMLRNNLNEFKTYKHLAGRLDSVTSIMYQTEEKLEEFLANKNIQNSKATPLRFAKTLDIEDKKRYYNDLVREKTTLESNLNMLDARHEEIWEQLTEINNSDRSESNIVERIIQMYLDEVGRYASVMDVELQEEEENSELTEDSDEDA